MKRFFTTLIIMFLGLGQGFADSIFFDSFEFANHDGETPIGWTCDDESWICGHYNQDHNRMAHSGEWYAYNNSADAWMFIPMFIGNSNKYRFSLWSITDGGYDLEVWAGNEANQEAMTQRLLFEAVTNTSYEKFTAFIDELSADYNYIGIHALSAYTSENYITIDDINIDIVYQYDFNVNPYEMHTEMNPGDQISFKCKMISDGYEPLVIYMTPHSSHFTDVHFFVDGEQVTSFPIDAFSSEDITMEATLSSTVEPGSTCWVDIMFTIDCGCATSMFTLWANVTGDGVEENYYGFKMYPNPSKGAVTLEGDGMISIYNSLGQEILRKEIIEKEIITLDKGVYFIRKDNGEAKTLIVE